MPGREPGRQQQPESLAEVGGERCRHVVCAGCQCLGSSLRRSMSLSTIAILNSVKKAVEAKSRTHSRSLGALPFSVESGSPEKSHSPGKP